MGRIKVVVERDGNKITLNCPDEKTADMFEWFLQHLEKAIAEILSTKGRA